MGYGAASPDLLFGFCMDDAQFGCGGPFGECISKEADRNYGSSEHVVGIRVDLKKLTRGYISKEAHEYGRVLWETLGIKCDFYLTTCPEEDCTEMIKPLEFVKSVKKDWTKEQCEEAIRKIAKVTDNDYVDHESYKDELDDWFYETNKKMRKEFTDEVFESFKEVDYLLVDKDESSDVEEDIEECVRYDPKEFEELYA